MDEGKRLYLCSLCNGLTPLKMKKTRLSGGVQHNYAECQSCKGKTTHSYTDQHIRGLLAKQKKILPGIKKEKLAEKIITEMNELRKKHERKKV